MKKRVNYILQTITVLFLMLALAVSLSACGKNKKAASSASASPSASPSNAPLQAAEAYDAQKGKDEKAEKADQSSGNQAPPTLAPSTNKTVIHNDEEAPTVYWTIDISYHLKGCPELEGKEVSEISWAMVKEVGLRQCPVCNPPQYENYIENDD